MDLWWPLNTNKLIIVMTASKKHCTHKSQRIHPWRLTWNIIMEVWKIIFLSKWVLCRFHVNLPGCMFLPLFKLHLLNKVMGIRQACRLHHIGRELIATCLKWSCESSKLPKNPRCKHEEVLTSRELTYPFGKLENHRLKKTEGDMWSFPGGYLMPPSNIHLHKLDGHHFKPCGVKFVKFHCNLDKKLRGALESPFWGISKKQHVSDVMRRWATHCIWLVSIWKN